MGEIETKHFEELNEDFDSVLRRKSTLLTGEPRALWEKLAEMEGKAELNLFGNPRDIEGLDAEFVRRAKDIDAEGLREYRGLKLRAEWAKERNFGEKRNKNKLIGV